MLPALALVSVFLLSSCITQTQDVEPAVTNQKIPSKCEGEVRPCDNAQSPTLCSTSSLGSDVLLKSHTLQGWGNSQCAAKRKLLDEVCQQGKDPAKISGISCVPDPSAGECPYTPKHCEKEEGLLLCVTKEYGRNPVSLNQGVYAIGQGRCDTTNKLRQKACRWNLRPSLLTSVECEPATVAAECPPKATACPRRYDPYVCSVLMGEVVEVFGTNECIARSQLAELACKKIFFPLQ